MLEFLVDNIFVAFAGKVFQRTISIPMGTNYVLLNADIFSISLRSGIYTVFAHNEKETFSVSVQSHLKVQVLSFTNPDFENY